MKVVKVSAQFREVAGSDVMFLIKFSCDYQAIEVESDWTASGEGCLSVGLVGR